VSVCPLFSPLSRDADGVRASYVQPAVEGGDTDDCFGLLSRQIAGFDVQGRVARLATGCGARGGAPAGDRRLVYPEGQPAPPAQARLIVPPVRHPERHLRDAMAIRAASCLYGMAGAVGVGRTGRPFHTAAPHPPTHLPISPCTNTRWWCSRLAFICWCAISALLPDDRSPTPKALQGGHDLTMSLDKLRMRLRPRRYAARWCCPACRREFRR
jgi:hypothetical protein